MLDIEEVHRLTILDMIYCNFRLLWIHRVLQSDCRISSNLTIDIQGYYEFDGCIICDFFGESIWNNYGPSFVLIGSLQKLVYISKPIIFIPTALDYLKWPCICGNFCWCKTWSNSRNSCISASPHSVASSSNSQVKFPQWITLFGNRVPNLSSWIAFVCANSICRRIIEHFIACWTCLGIRAWCAWVSTVSAIETIPIKELVCLTWLSTLFSVQN